jgi:hypothetical protein
MNKCDQLKLAVFKNKVNKLITILLRHQIEMSNISIIIKYKMILILNSQILILNPGRKYKKIQADMNRIMIIILHSNQLVLPIEVLIHKN